MSLNKQLNRLKNISSHNELLECLVIFTKLMNNPYTAEALTAGLPTNKDGVVELFSVSSKGSKSLFSRAASRAGLSTSVVKKNLSEISPLLMPCILMLKDEKACILHSIKDGIVSITLPDNPDGVVETQVDKLKELYLGFAWYLKRQYEPKDTKHLINNRQGHWFWDTIKISKSIYIDVIIASIAINIFAIVSPLFTMNVYDRVVPNNAIETLWVLALGALFIFVIDMVLKLSRIYFLDLAAKKSDIIMNSILFENVLDMDFSDKPKNVGSYANNLKEFDTIRNFLTSSTTTILIDFPFAIIFLIVAYFLGGTIVIIPIVVMLLVLIYSLSIKRPLQKSIKSTYEAVAKKSGILIESLNGLETIKTMGSAGRTQFTWEQSSGEIATKSAKTKLITASLSTLTGFLVQFNTIAIVIFGVYKIGAAELSMGALIAIVMLSSRAIAPMGQAASLLSNYEQTKTAYASLDKIIKSKKERPVGNKFIRRTHLAGKIEFDNVSFSYDNENTYAISNVSLIIQPGEKVGIIGKNGSGKSTIEKLVLGLYKPTSGRILIDDIDINQLDPADLRKNIAYVPQEVVLFNGTIRSNILEKAPWASDEDLIRAASISGVDEYVNASPKGYDTPIYERGDGISGGQRQAIAIARAMLLDASIIMLDEPAASLDIFAEVKLKQTIAKAIESETLILVSHNISMLDLVDRLIVLDRGKIVLDGNSKEIIDKYLYKKG